MRPYMAREILHTGFALAVTVLVALAADLTGIASFDEVSLSGLAVTAVRSLATATVTLFSRYAVKG